MKHLFLLLLVIVGFGFTADAALSDLRKWKGKYPINEDPRFKNIFEVPEVKSALNKMLTQTELRRLTHTYAVMSQISLIHDYLIVQVCLPHFCPAENAMLAIDLKREQFHVGFYQHRKNVTIKWISSDGDFQEFPKEVQDAFYYMHHPK